MIYECPRCAYSTNLASNFLKHLNRRIICDPINSDISIENIKTDFINRKMNEYECKYCHKKYSSNESLKKHKQRCSEFIDKHSILKIESQTNNNNTNCHNFNNTNNINNIISKIFYMKIWII